MPKFDFISLTWHIYYIKSQVLVYVRSNYYEDDYYEGYFFSFGMFCLKYVGFLKLEFKNVGLMQT